MDRALSDTPMHLSSLKFDSKEVLRFNLGWDFKGDYFEVSPIIHLFDKFSRRVDIVCMDKRSSQGVKITSFKGNHYELELNMGKLPSYVDSIYFSLGSVDKDIPLKNLENLYLDIHQGEVAEVWGVQELTINSSIMSLASIEKRDMSLYPGSGDKWNFNFINESLLSNYQRVHGILDKESLFQEKMPEASFFKRLRMKFISLILSTYP